MIDLYGAGHMRLTDRSGWRRRQSGRPKTIRLIGTVFIGYLQISPS